MPKNEFTWRIKDFDTLTKIALECRRFGQINRCERLWKVQQIAQSGHIVVKSRYLIFQEWMQAIKIIILEGNLIYHFINVRLKSIPISVQKYIERIRTASAPMMSSLLYQLGPKLLLDKCFWTTIWLWCKCSTLFYSHCIAYLTLLGKKSPTNQQVCLKDSFFGKCL